MKNIYIQLKFVIVFAILSLFTQNIFAQPKNIFGNFGTGWASTDLVDRGVVKSAVIQANANTNAPFLFTNAPGNYDPKWSGSTSSFSRTVDTYLDGSAYYCAGTNCATWSKDLEVTMISGNRYTFIIDATSPTATTNRTFSILETSYFPVSISAVSQLPASNVKSTEPVEITATLSLAKNAEEKVFVRYTIDGWVTSSFVEITSFDGSLKGKASIPAQIAGKKVEYYVLTTKQTTPDGTKIDYFTLNLNNNTNLNYSYTVISDPTAPSITIASDGTITEGAENGEIITVTLVNDVFEASLTPANWTITNLPAGVTAAIARVSDTKATITLSGNTSADYDVDITNLTVSISNLELVTLSTGAVSVSSGVTFTAVIEAPSTAIWMHLITSENFVKNIGDAAIWIDAEIGQATWDGTQIGYGLSKTDNSAWTFVDAVWYEDGTAPNKKVHAQIPVPSTSGTYYYVARARALTTDAWTYANTSTWTNSLAFAPEYTITVNAPINPDSCKFVLNLGSDVSVCGGESIIIDPKLKFSPSADSLVINFNANYGTATLVNSPKVYIHFGAEINNSGAWDFAVGNWGLDDGIGLMKNKGNNQWQITIHPQSYFGYEKGVYPTKFFVVFRNTDGTIVAKDNLDADIKIDMASGSPVSSYASVTTGQIKSEYKSILWSTGATTETLAVAEAGTYFATVTTNEGCFDTDTIIVKIGEIPFVNIGSGGVLCGTQSLYLVAPNTFTSYKWQDNSTNDSMFVATAGTYSVTVTNADGCTGFDVVTYAQSDVPVADFSFEINDKTVKFTNLSTWATSFAWDFDGNGSTDNTTENPTKIYVLNGTYTVKLKAKNSCGENTVTKQILLTAVYLIENSEISIYPNPVKDILNLNLVFENKTDVEIIVRDILSKEIFSLKNKNVSGKYFQSIDLSKFNNGTYILEIISNNKKQNQLIIKK
jgi:hypothetical protein